MTDTTFLAGDIRKPLGQGKGEVTLLPPFLDYLW